MPSRIVRDARFPALMALLGAPACTGAIDGRAAHADGGTADGGPLSGSGAAMNGTGGALANGGGVMGMTAGGAAGQRSSGGAPGGGGTSSNGGTSSSGGASSGGAPGSGGASGGGTSGNAGSSASGGASASGGSAGKSGSGGASGVAAVRVVGRTDGNSKSPRFEWSSVSIQARFKGTSVTADLDGGDNNYFEIVVDGQTRPRVATTNGRSNVPIISGLADAEHDLVIWRRAEANNAAPTQFFGLDLGGGTLLPISAPPHKLEIIGDSLTCGYGNEGAGPGCPFTYDTEDSYLAYGAVAARALDADLYTECWSGKGMYRNNGGDTNEPMPVLFDRTIPTDSSSTWNFSSWTPDAVVINLATNDFATGDPGQPFVDAYKAFVVALRKHYPKAYVFLIDGPSMSGQPLVTAQGYLDQVVKAQNGAGDTRIAQIKVTPQDQAKNGIGCDYHPSAATDAIMGKALAVSIKSTMGW
ncbi:MAG TPA: GDSL-type esterase/lipase family protein [Polyangiaceae bacterium]|jgi:hypothetical protein|nr:GDSL-type esterase/lipase family protein [Polyangiaceae bacterium]